MAQFIRTLHNKFENKTTTEGMPCRMWEKRGDSSWWFVLRQVSTPDFDTLVVDISLMDQDWFYLRNGDLTFNLDGKKNIILDAHESYSKVHNAIIEENCFYEITEKQLKEICDASEVDIQVTGDSRKKQIDGELFRLYARAYYKAVYDNTLFGDALSTFLKAHNKKKIVKRRLIIGAAVIAVLGAIYGITAGGVKEYECYNYDVAAQRIHQVELGMSYKDVIKICGKPTFKYYAVHQVYCIRYFREKHPYNAEPQVEIMFKNGKVRKVYESTSNYWLE